MICVRGNCAEAGQGKQLEKRLVELIQQYGLDDLNHSHYTSCTVTNCLGVCMNGPIMIVHPEGIKYQHVDKHALERIFQQHLLHDQPVEELIIHHQPSHSLLKSRQSGSSKDKKPKRKW